MLRQRLDTAGSQRRHRSAWPIVCLMSILLGSCGTGDAGTSTTDSPTPSAQPDLGSASSTIAAPPVTNTSTTPTTVTLTTGGADASTSTSVGSFLDLVVVGDSFVGWSAWPEMYTALASDALGASVALDESLAGTGTPRRLDQILNSESAQDVIASAEILVVQPQPGWAAGPAFNAYFAGECGGEANADCLASLADEFSTYTNEYFDVLLDLVAPGTIIRVASTATWAPEGFYPNLREDDPDTLFLFIDAVAAMMKESEKAAAARGIPTVDVSAAFNGREYIEPAPGDYLVADRLHLDTKGSEIVAELLHGLGYRPTVTD